MSNALVRPDDSHLLHFRRPIIPELPVTRGRLEEPASPLERESPVHPEGRDFVMPKPGIPLSPSLRIAGALGGGSQCCSIDFAFQSTAWPLILLEKHCKLWGKGSLLTCLTSWVSAAACPGVDELSRGPVTCASSARGSDLPALSQIL